MFFWFQIETFQDFLHPKPRRTSRRATFTRFQSWKARQNCQPRQSCLPHQLGGHRRQQHWHETSKVQTWVYHFIWHALSSASSPVLSLTYKQQQHTSISLFYKNLNPNVIVVRCFLMLKRNRFFHFWCKDLYKMLPKHIPNISSQDNAILYLLAQNSVY